MKKGLIYLFLALELVIYAAFLFLDLTGRGGMTLWLKYSGVLLCFLFALLCAVKDGDRLIAPALLLTACADWFLLVRGDHLIVGVLFFLCVQTIYLLRLRRERTTGLWLRLVLPVLLISLLFALKLVTLLNVLAMLYFSQLLSSALLAWSLPRFRLFALGLTLFVGCDVCVGLFNTAAMFPALYSFVSVGMWAFYLPSQVLIVLSALPSEKGAVS